MNRLESVANRFFEWYDLRELAETGIVTFTGQMRRSPFDRLTPGILNRVLSSVPNILTLQAFVLTGPKVHDIFKSHRDEIVQSIMEQELGQGLCYARAVYYACEYATNTTEECFEDPQLHFHGSISTKEARALSHYGCTANRLATYFSTFYKDRSAPSSQLSRLEYFYFQRALFRFWALAYIANKPEWRESPWADSIGFVSALPRGEIAQIADVHIMLYRLVRWKDCEEDILIPSDGAGQGGMPDSILQCIDDQVPSELWSLPGGIVDADMWTCSKVPVGMSILTDGRLHSDECVQCGKTNIMLWGHDNWHLFRCFSAITSLQKFMPGNLRFHNQVYIDFLRISEIPHYASILYKEILRVRPDSGCLWSSDMYLCKTCLLRHFRKRVYIWYFHEKRGVPFRPDCPYGWNCESLVRAQGWRDHNRQYNHFCRPDPLAIEAYEAHRLETFPPFMSPIVNDCPGYHLARSVFAFSVIAFVLLQIALGMAKSFVVEPMEWIEWFLRPVLVGGMVLYEGRLRRQDNPEVVN